MYKIVDKTHPQLCLSTRLNIEICLQDRGRDFYLKSGNKDKLVFNDPDTIFLHFVTAYNFKDR